MAQVAAVAAVISAATSLWVAKEQFSAADEARDIADRNAERKRLETEEAVRRTEKANERQFATAKARAAATGIDPSTGSISFFLRDLEDEQTAELDWLKRSGYDAADVLEEEGEYAQRIGRMDAIGTIGGIAGSAGRIYSSGQSAKWWK